MRRARLRALAAALTFLGPVRAQAAGWYIGGEAGWIALADEPARAMIPVIGQRNDRERWSDGYDFGARAGYGWDNWRLEEEFRFQRNGAATFAGAAATGNGTAYALMTDLLYELPRIGVFAPHLGAGVGAGTVRESIATAGFSSGAATGSDTGFGYQAIGGFDVMLSPSVAVDLDYRYLAAAPLRFRTPSGFVDSGHPAGNLPVASGYRTYSLVASVIYRFGSGP